MSRKYSRNIFVALLGLIGASGCATVPHGESELGPHGGFIKMPGEFHVEVVPRGAKDLDVYLLDLSSKDPLTIASKLSGTVTNRNSEANFECPATNDHFRCHLPEGYDLTEGELKIHAVRRERTGRPVVYSLPLHLPKTTG